MSTPTHITPPPDAPIPWSQWPSHKSMVVDERQNTVATFASPDFAAYAIAAANALPGLVKACEKVVARGHYDTCSHALVSEHDCSCPVALAIAALAALTKEPTR